MDLVELNVSTTDAPCVYHSSVTFGRSKDCATKPDIRFDHDQARRFGLFDLMDRVTAPPALFPDAQVTHAECQRFGQHLFEHFLPFEINKFLQTRKDRPVRFALTVPPELAGLPWETLWTQTHKHLALCPRCSVFRLCEGPRIPGIDGRASVLYSQQTHVEGSPLITIDTSFHDSIQRHSHSPYQLHPSVFSANLPFSAFPAAFAHHRPQLFLHIGHTQLHRDGSRVYCCLKRREGAIDDEVPPQGIADAIRLTAHAPLHLAVFAACHTAGFYDAPAVRDCSQPQIFAQEFATWSKLTIGMLTAADANAAQVLIAALMAMLKRKHDYRPELSHFDLALSLARRLLRWPARQSQTDLVMDKLVADLAPLFARLGVNGRLGLKRAGVQWWVPVLYATDADDTALFIERDRQDSPLADTGWRDLLRHLPSLRY